MRLVREEIETRREQLNTLMQTMMAMAQGMGPMISNIHAINRPSWKPNAAAKKAKLLTSEAVKAQMIKELIQQWEYANQGMIVGLSVASMYRTKFPEYQAEAEHMMGHIDGMFKAIAAGTSVCLIALGSLRPGILPDLVLACDAELTPVLDQVNTLHDYLNKLDPAKTAEVSLFDLAMDIVKGEPFGTNKDHQKRAKAARRKQNAGR